jgi:hypothetical protein
VKRIGVIGVARWTFRERPAVVGTWCAFVDFLPGDFADVIDEQTAGAALDRRGEGLRRPRAPDRAIDPSRRTEERIVGRDAAIAIDPQHLAKEVAE